MKKFITLSGIFTILAISSMAQSKIKDGTATGSATLPNKDAVLELESGNKGLLLPRIALTATNSPLPLSANVAGMAVYNTTTAGSGATAVTPGYYYNDGSQWVKVSSTSALPTSTWNIQGTTNASQSVTDKVYHTGNVAVNVDTVTTKTLTVGGDVLFQKQGADGNYYGLQTNYTTSNGLTQNLFYASSDPNFLTTAASTATFGEIGIGNGYASAAAASPTSSAVYSVTTGGIIMNYADQTYSQGFSTIPGKTGMKYSKNDYGAEVNIKDTGNIEFYFYGRGDYLFPRTNGTANQVLSTPGGIGQTQLAWKDANTYPIKSGNSLTTSDYTLEATGNVTLPVPSVGNTGKVYNLVYSGTTVTITGVIKQGSTSYSSYTLNGSAGGTGLTIQSDGTNWIVTGKF
ncbi:MULTISPECIES: hypothetical protein [Chitinophagaceae]